MRSSVGFPEAMVAWACDFRAENVETDGFLEVDGQPAQPTWPLRDPNTESKMYDWGMTWRLSSGLHTKVHVNTWAPHTHLNLPENKKYSYLTWA